VSVHEAGNGEPERRRRRGRFLRVRGQEHAEHEPKGERAND
jgi:hypothetical protein